MTADDSGSDSEHDSPAAALAVTAVLGVRRGRSLDRRSRFESAAIIMMRPRIMIIVIRLGVSHAGSLTAMKGVHPS